MANPRKRLTITDQSSSLIETCDLVVDRVYRGGRSGNAGDDRLSRMLGVCNQGGFRYLGTPEDAKLIVITSNFSDPDWPDVIDKETGILTYFGDNKHAGRLLHETPRKGNLLLRNIFEFLHATPSCREKVPPILVFQNTGEYRDVQFLGVAVPSVEGMPQTEDLVAVWKVAHGRRFQNYRSVFTILNMPVVCRDWLEDIRSGISMSPNAPSAWVRWVRTGQYAPLVGTRTIQHRTRSEQLPRTEHDADIIRLIHERFEENPVAFERVAVELARMSDGAFVDFVVTRPSRDGGRDAIGKYRIGSGASAILVDCALEAKCYSMNKAVGVREVSRLISRLRHRQFGVLVTSSYLHEQAYREIKADGHPVVIISASDIVAILARAGMSRTEAIAAWLDTFPN